MSQSSNRLWINIPYVFLFTTVSCITIQRNEDVEGILTVKLRSTNQNSDHDLTVALLTRLNCSETVDLLKHLIVVHLNHSSCLQKRSNCEVKWGGEDIKIAWEDCIT